MSTAQGAWQAVIALAPLELPQEVEARLAEVFKQVGQATFDWPHLTLVQFTDKARLEAVTEGLDQLARVEPPVQLQIHGAGLLDGTMSPQSVVYLGARKTPELTALQHRVAALAGPSVQDFYKTAAWLPHLSVLYTPERYTSLVQRLTDLTFELRATHISLRDGAGQEHLFKLEGLDS